ncbi:Outer membrane porin protein 32 [Xylophilus ampelinus]|uniref:Porin n=1 Tax=Variovorax paradoxus TaxID=34073 RepID=A0A2W5QCH1_VARPD|nr:porin [Variovorax sp.]PZQ76091.1 MAG: porin [Variovorax paradoxus]PZU73936.1 MAG: porin [Sphingomonas sp.]VTY34748.1 Outer membrane porin protein 32 [Xylophilus ampelinus]
MFKTCIAAAVASLACVSAFAQSNVTLFGIVDASVRSVSNKSDRVSGSLFTPTSFKSSRTELATGGLSSSRLGFRGVEDLGGGLYASFWLEAPLRNDDGSEALAFTRRSIVAVGGAFGEIRLGRDNTPIHLNHLQWDPFQDTGLGASLLIAANGASNPNNVAATGGFGSNSNYKRASNMVQYFLPPNLGGFYGNIAYGFSEQSRIDFTQNVNTGRYIGGRAGYKAGPLDAAIAYGESDTAYSNRLGKIKTFNVGASYDFGVVKLFGDYTTSADRRDNAVGSFVSTPKVDMSGYSIAATVPVGVGQIRASYAQVKYDLNSPLLFNAGDPSARKFVIGYVHNLSKRTALYTNVARITNKNGAGLSLGGPSYVTAQSGATYTPKTSTGYEFGIRHSF